MQFPIQTDAYKVEKDVYAVESRIIEQHLLSYCNDYVRDLYTSDLNLDYDKIDVFSFLQQISFTSYGKDTFSSLSILMDSLCIQNDKYSKALADAALVTFSQNLSLSRAQKEELISLIEERYRVSSIRGINLVISRITENLGLNCPEVEEETVVNQDGSKYIIKRPEIITGEPEKNSGVFILVSGIPGSGKTKAAENEAKALEERGIEHIPVASIYSISDISEVNSWLGDTEHMLQESIQKNKRIDNGNKYIVVSANEARKEVVEYRVSDKVNDTAFALADARIAGALCSGCSVIYEATNLDASVKSKYLGMAIGYGVNEKKLILCPIDIEKAKESRPDIDTDKLKSLQERFESGRQDESDGWDIVEELEPVEEITIQDDFEWDWE